MVNPLNPLDWIKSTQDWFVKTERSSGFRPYLIFLILAFGLGLVLLFAFPDRVIVEYLAVMLIGGSAAAFILLYTWKARTDPNFCRSESHLERIRHMELEMMGSESKQITGAVFEQISVTNAQQAPKLLGDRGGEEVDK